jgi:hypothetical protein
MALIDPAVHLVVEHCEIREAVAGGGAEDLGAVGGAAVAIAINHQDVTARGDGGDARSVPVAVDWGNAGRSLKRKETKGRRFGGQPTT